MQTAAAVNDAICYLNGEFLPLSEAKISVLDRGFIFGDGVYEVVPVYQRRLFRFPEHMARLARSLGKIGMTDPMGGDGWLKICRELVSRFGAADEQMVYLQVTRGVAKRDHAFPRGVTPTVFAMTSALPVVPPELRERGVSCLTASDFRWHKGDIKSTSLLGAVLARQISAEQGAAETILLRDGYLTEASASNVWIVKNGVLAAPVKDHLKLEGIRYGLLELLAARVGLPLEMRSIGESELRGADEVLLTSATKEVLAVTNIDGRAVGAGRPGPVYAQLYAAYQQAKPEFSL